MIQTIDGIGKIVFKKSPKAKQINITVKPFEHVVVSVPRKITLKQAQTSVTDNLSWIRKEKLKMSEVEKLYTVFVEGTRFKTRTKEFVIRITKGRKVEVNESGDQIFICIPSSRKIDSFQTQQYIRDQIEKELRKEAVAYLPGQVNRATKQAGIRINKVSIRKSKTRWGSLSKDDTLNLSYFLMLLPDHLIEYAILHELAHVKVKDHSKEYWMHLESLVKDAKKLDKEIRKVPIGVI